MIFHFHAYVSLIYTRSPSVYISLLSFIRVKTCVHYYVQSLEETFDTKNDFRENLLNEWIKKKKFNFLTYTIPAAFTVVQGLSYSTYIYFIFLSFHIQTRCTLVYVPVPLLSLCACVSPSRQRF